MAAAASDEEQQQARIHSTTTANTIACHPLGVNLLGVIHLVRAVMAMYTEANTSVKTQDGPSDKFKVKVGLHQGSVLSPLLFVSVMKVIACERQERDYHGSCCMLMTWC